MKGLEANIDVHSYNFCVKIDANRVKNAEHSLTNATKQARSAMNSSRKEEDKINFHAKGLFYGSGISDGK